MFANKKSRNLQALFEISRQATANLEQQQMLEGVVQAIQDVMGYHMASILLVNESRTALISSAISSNLWGKIPLGDRVPLGRGMVGQAAITKQTQLANRVQDNPHYLRAPGGWDPGSELSVPLIADGMVIGVLDVEDEAQDAFTEEDVQTLETLARQLVVVLEKARLFSDARENLKDLSVIYEISQRLSLARNPDEVLRVALHALAEHSRYRCTLALFEFDPQTGKPTRFFIPYFFQPGEGVIQVNEFVPTSEDDLNDLLDEGQTVAIPNVADDPRVPDFLKQEQARVGRPALALIPLIAGRRRIGNLILSYTQPHPWTDAELRLFRLAANLIATSVENTRHFQREQELAAVEERQRLARDLHDSVTQLIFSVMLVAQSIGSAFKKNPAEGERRIQRMLDLSQQALTEMRALLAELRPASPVEAGLIPALRQYIERISARERLDIRFTESHYLPHPQPTEEALFRIVQEALNNTVKHARAKTVEIVLCCQSGQVHLTISDNGRGVSPESLQLALSNSRFGLRGIRERAESLGGRMKILSELGTGTTIRVTIPDQPRTLEHGT
ncbi:MAG: hypothetical protein Fur0022_09860 [Anaerolineales bacterium]